MLCPCCKQEMPGGDPGIEILEKVPLAIVPKTILNELVRTYPRAVTREHLISVVYNTSNEPETADMAIRVQLTRIREHIRYQGWTISKGMPGRGNSSKYKLERLP